MTVVAGPGPDQHLGRVLGVEVCVNKPVRSSDLHDALMRLLARTTTVEAGVMTVVAGPGPDQHLGRVLVVEDNELNQIVAESFLRSLGYDVMLAADGRRALDALAADDFDAVLMDCHMPEMDGYEATAELRRREGTGRRTPVIAMTAGVLAEDRERCAAAGMDDFVPKPVDADLLGQTVARWVGGSTGSTVQSRAPQVTTPPAVLEHQRLDVLRRIGPDDGWGMLPAVVEAFLGAAPGHAAAITAASGADDIDGMENLLHRLRGSAANLGAARLADRCANLERLVREGRLPAPSEIAVLEAELVETCEALSSLLLARACRSSSSTTNPALCSSPRPPCRHSGMSA
jgi:CheY-like chemotaxis protein/HPt (histidine-containing phosphotransfer) domain-containing protein